MKNVFTSQFQKQLASDNGRAGWFIVRLVAGGIPRSAVATNDFSSNLVPRVYITVPYGRPGGGLRKSYERWNTLTVKLALKWWRTVTKNTRN